MYVFVRSLQAGAGHVAEDDASTQGEPLTAPEEPARTGYTFAGWFVDGGGTEAAWNFENNAVQSMTLKAKWTPVSYAVSLDLQGGRLATEKSDASDGNQTLTYTTETGLSLPQPVKDGDLEALGYTFAGWTGTGLSEKTIEVKIPAGSTGGRSYTASWIKDTREGSAEFIVSGSVSGGISSETPSTEDAVDGIREAEAQSQAAAAGIPEAQLQNAGEDENKKANEVSVSVTAKAVADTRTAEQTRIKEKAFEDFGAGASSENVATDFIEASVTETQSYVSRDESGKEEQQCVLRIPAHIEKVAGC